MDDTAQITMAQPAMAGRPRPLVIVTAALVTALAGCRIAAVNVQPRVVTAFEGARVITGDGSQPIVDAVLVVRDGIITDVGARLAVTPPADARRVDLRGRTVIPLLVNVHGHVGYMRGTTTDKAHYSRENVLDHLRRLAYYGVGAIQSLGTDRDGVELRIRDEQHAGTLSDLSLARLFTAGNGLVAPTPGSTNGGPFFATDVVHEATSAADARKYVRALAAKKPDIVKLWVDNRGGTKAKLTPEVYRAIIDEAHAQQLRAIAHVYDLDDAKGLVRSGVDGLAHMVRAEPGTDEELVALIKSRNVFACTTMSIQKALVDDPSWLDDPALAETQPADVVAAWKAGLAKASPDAIGRAKAGYALLERSLKTLSDGGARIVLCGDTGLNSQAPGFTEHRELEAMARAGMPPLQAIRAATSVGAEVLGLRDRGTLAAGRQADFIVLTANPLDDMANSRRIAAVYRNGTAIDRDRLRTAWARPAGATSPQSE